MIRYFQQLYYFGEAEIAQQIILFPIAELTKCSIFKHVSRICHRKNGCNQKSFRHILHEEGLVCHTYVLHLFQRSTTINKILRQFDSFAICRFDNHR